MAKSGTTSRPRKTNRPTPSTNAQRLTEITLARLEDRKCRTSGVKEPRTLFSLSFVLGTLSHAAGTSHANFGKAQETSEGKETQLKLTQKDSKTRHSSSSIKHWYGWQGNGCCVFRTGHASHTVQTRSTRQKSCVSLMVWIGVTRQAYYLERLTT